MQVTLILISTILVLQERGTMQPLWAWKPSTFISTWDEIAKLDCFALP